MDSYTSVSGDPDGIEARLLSCGANGGSDDDLVGAVFHEFVSCDVS